MYNLYKDSAERKSSRKNIRQNKEVLATLATLAGFCLDNFSTELRKKDWHNDKKKNWGAGEKERIAVIEKEREREREREHETYREDRGSPTYVPIRVHV